MNTLNTSGKTSITIDGSILLGGEYSHINKDLIISTDSDTTVVKDYFVNLPTLVSPQGATLTPNLVSSLSAYQSNEFVAFEDPKAIGEITVTDGPISITRVGQKIELQQGDFIYLNDLVDVGQNTVGITFKDDTALSLEPGAKMVVDEFYYDPEANQGGMNADVIGGSFSFVSGNIAKVGNDAMTVSTPVLTIGVRGTQVAGRANQEGEDNEIVLLPNADGTVGEIMIKNDSGEVILTEAYQATTITSSIMPPTVPVILPKEIVLKKYAKTISTTRKTEKIKEVERETEEATKEKEEAESEKEQLEEEAEELEEEAEQLEEEKEQLEEEAEQLEEEKEQLEEKAEELKEEIAELEEKLENADADEIEEIQEELAEAEQEIEEVEEQVEEVLEEEKVIEQKVEQVEEKVEEVKQEVQQIEQKVEFVEEKIVQVEEKFDAIVEEFEVFQEEFVQEFQDFIPEEEIEQFMEEAPLEIIEEFQEKIIEKLENDGVELKENIEEEPEDIFAEENVKEKLEEIEEKQEELIEKADELMEKDMQLQEEAQALEEEAKALEDEAKALEEAAEEAYANNDEEAIQEIEQKFQEIDEERQQIDQGFEEINEQYEELDENFEELNNEFFAMDEELQEVFQDGPMVVRVPEDGPGYNEDNDVFNVPEDQQIDINVEEFLAEEKEKAMQNNEFAIEADNFFNDQEVQEALPDNIDDNVQDMMIIGAGNLDEYFVGAGAGIETPEDFYAEDPMEDFYNIVDNNEDLYYAEQDAQDFMDDIIEDLAVQNNINVAPWLDMPNNVTVTESNAKTSGTVVGYVYGSDANGDTLTYSIFDDPTGALSLSGNTITWDGTFGNITQDTTYTVLLKVQDPYGASDVDSFNITVTADSFVTYTKATVGVHYQDDGANQSGGEQVAPVMAEFVEDIGHTASIMTSFTSSNLNDLDLLWVTESYSTNNPFASAMASGGAINTWVYNGGTLIFHDRSYSNNEVLPNTGGSNFLNSSRQDSDDVTFASGTSLLTNGPAGVMYSTLSDAISNSGFTLDGGSASTHGRTQISSLPTDAVVTIFDDDQNENYATDFWYGYGSGHVYYSHVPLDCYIGGNCDQDNSNNNRSDQNYRGIWDEGSDVYSQNLLHYMLNQVKYTSTEQHKYQGTGAAEAIAGTHNADIIVGGGGSDELWGGGGADVFVYNSIQDSTTGSGRDLILDFNASEDSIDISAITNGASFHSDVGGSTVYFDIDNNGSWDMNIILSGTSLTIDDITVVS